MAQMMALLTDLANQVKNFMPVAPAVTTPTPNASGNAPTIDSVDKGLAEEVPVNAIPAIIDLEAPPKESPVIHMEVRDVSQNWKNACTCCKVTNSKVLISCRLLQK